MPREVDVVRAGRPVPRGVGVVRGGPPVSRGASVVRGGPPLPCDIVDGGGRASYASVLVAGGVQPCVSSSTDAISLCSAASDDTEVQTYFAARQVEDNKKKQRCERERSFEQKQRDRAVA